MSRACEKCWFHLCTPRFMSARLSRLSLHFTWRPCRYLERYYTASSNVHRGVQFETRALSLLEQHFSMSLKRVGGRGDGGIDMLGWWWIPNFTKEQRKRIRVIAQCKAEKKKIGPKYVRELEGVLLRYHMSNLLNSNQVPDGVDGSEVSDDRSQLSVPHHIPSVGVLISESAFTKATILHAQSSSIPLLLLHLPSEEDVTNLSSNANGLGAAIWNSALAKDQGPLGGHMEIRWERSFQGSNRPGLWWKNEKLPSFVPEGDFESSTEQDTMMNSNGNDRRRH